MVREFLAKDIKTIINLGQQINPNFTKLFKVENLPDNEVIFVYENNNEVIGFLHILINVDWIEILNVVVDEKHRGKGVASVLLDYLLSEVNIDTAKIILEVRESNTPAINLYKMFNFFVVNIRENYYGDENAIVMERSDSL